MTTQASRAAFSSTNGAMMHTHTYAPAFPAPSGGAPRILWPGQEPCPWPWPGPFVAPEGWLNWPASLIAGHEQLPAPVLTVSGLGLQERARAARVAATFTQVVAFVQNQGRAWNHGDRDDAPSVAADIRGLLDSSESDIGWLATVITEKQQQFEIAFASALAAAPVANQTKVAVAAELQKRGGIAEFALEALTQFRDAEARAELIGSGKMRLSSLGAYCMGSAALAGAQLALGDGWGAAATAIGMAAAGCGDL